MNDIDTRHIIDTIRQKRLELGYSYQDLADKTGISKSTIQRYETGAIRKFPIDKLEMLAKALEIDPGYLMGWKKVYDELTSIIPKGTRIKKVYKTLTAKDDVKRAFREFIRMETINNEYKAVDILTPYLVRKGFTVEFCEKGELGKIIATKQKLTWHLAFYLPYREQEEAEQGMLLRLSHDLVKIYGKIVCYKDPVNKFTIVLNSRLALEKFLENRPRNITIEASAMLIDLENNAVVEEITL